MEIVFVRHGLSQANDLGLIQGQGDYSLTPAGKDQALRTASALSGFGPYCIYTSPLTRARQTAEIINRKHNVPVEVLEDLAEYNLGEFEGLSFEEVKKRFPHVPEALSRGEPFHLLAPGGEKDEEVDLRASRALEQILDSGYPRVIVVSHLGLLERMIKIACKKYRIPLDHHQVWPLKNCSITWLDLIPMGSRLITVNDVSHLPRGA